VRGAYHAIENHSAFEEFVMYRGPILFPLVLIVLGFLLLFSNLGYIQFDFWQFVKTWWPLLLIIGGLDILIGSLRMRNVKARTLALDLGTATQGDISINFGAGDLTVGKAAPGKIVDGTFEGEVRYDAKPDGRVWLKLEPLNWWGWNPRGYRWNVGLTDAVPLKLTLDGGAANANLDLTDLKVTDLRVKTGASGTVVRLPSAAGLTVVHVNAGAASVKLIVPAGVAARVHSTMAIGSNDINQQRFPRAGGDYVSPDYATAANKVDIQFDGGVGSLAVV
jgi:hypothetical protein